MSLVAGAAIVAGISAASSFFEQKRANRALEARKAWAGEEKKYNKKVFELETFQRYYSTEQAGAQRIFMAAGLGGGTQGSQALSQFDDFMLDRDLVLSDFQFQHSQRRIDQEIDNLGRQQASPWKTALWRGATAGVETYTLGGGFDKKPNGKIPVGGK